MTCSIETAFIDEATLCDPAFCGNDLVICDYVEDKLMGIGIKINACSMETSLSTGKIQKSFDITCLLLPEDTLRLLWNPFGRKGKTLLRANYPVRQYES